MYVRIRHLTLVGFLAALPTSVQAADQPAETAEEDAVAAPAETATEATETPASSVEGQIVLQSENTILAEDLIGSRVYSGPDETVGHINDLIIDFDGGVEGVVIGVGGFLGIGEKDVAVEMDSLSLNSDPELGTVHLVLRATRDELEAAPAFKTAAEQQLEEESELMQQNLDTGVPSTTPELTEGTAGN